MNQDNYLLPSSCGDGRNQFGAFMAFGPRQGTMSAEDATRRALGLGGPPSPAEGRAKRGSGRGGLVWHQTATSRPRLAAAFAGLSPQAPRHATAKPDPEDGLNAEPDPDPEDKNEADVIPASVTTRAVTEAGTLGGDGTINPPFP